jgi:hypothetical protein
MNTTIINKSRRSAKVDNKVMSKILIIQAIQDRLQRKIIRHNKVNK